ncbi:MAG: hypothetical protein ACLPUG_16580 [Acidimicrobiales bacterium]|jgi:hypothetical protein
MTATASPSVNVKTEEREVFRLDVGTATSIVKDADVLQADERLEDLTRISDDEGAS